MRLYYDTEFLEDGSTIRLISIGMIREDGVELYQIVDDLALMLDAYQHPWLAANVLPYLPVTVDAENRAISWDESHPDFQYVASREAIAKRVKGFCESSMDDFGRDKASLWAWFGAYDHVCLAQLFGKMIDLPYCVPMRTNDLAQEVERRGLWHEVPQMPGVQSHNALSDARELKYRYEYLERFGE